MKKLSLFLTFSLLFAFMFQAAAQQDERTISTRIADILAQMPAGNEKDLNTAMTEMEALGETGLIQLAQQMAPAEGADNSRIQYAIMGYTAFVSSPGKEVLRKIAETAWCKTLSSLKNKNHISFIKGMLEIIGTDQSVSCVAPFLNDDMLVRKATATLASIGIPAAGKVLVEALGTPSVPKNALLQALGNMRYQEGVKEISTFAVSGEKMEKAAALYALAEIGDPSSAGLLLQETGKDGGNFSDKEATAIYASYISNLNVRGHTELAGKLAASFYKQSGKSNVLAKTAALRTLVEMQQGKAMKQLVKAAADNDPAYRNEALALATPFLTDENSGAFIKKLKKASPAVQADLIRFLGRNGNSAALNAVTKYAATAKNAEVKSAAIIAMAQIGGEDITAGLLNILKSSSGQEEAVKQALLLSADPDLTGLLISRISEFSGSEKAALLEVLGEKQEGQGFPVIAEEISSQDAAVKKAALQALPDVSGKESLPRLFNLLTAVRENPETDIIQKAIVQAMSEIGSDSEKENIVLENMKGKSPEQLQLYFPVLGAIGTPKMLDIIDKAYQQSNGDGKQKALAALTSWPNSHAMNVLYSIASQGTEVSHKNAALSSYISLIKRAESTQEQKLLLLKKAMEVATTAAQKNQILGETAGIATFPALAFAAGYLDDKETRQRAADAVMNIGLSDKSFHGTLVREWLTKAMEALSGADAVYAQKSIQKFLDDMPETEGYVSLFNGKDLSGWKGLVGNPVTRSKMSATQLTEAQKKADVIMKNGWMVKDGELIFKGEGDNIATIKDFGDIELHLDWKIYDDGHKEGDAGVYLRGTPQVQIWDTSRVDVGAQVGSGGLYNNQKHESKPLKVADNLLGEWNHFYIKMIGDRVTVYLNGELVTDNVPLENYWDRNMPLFPQGQIEMQAHGSRIGYRDIYIKEITDAGPFELSPEEENEGYKVLFNGEDMQEWMGNTTDYVVEEGIMVVRPQPGSRGNLYSKEEYGDFIFRFEFRLTPGANNGLGIRTPLEGDAAYSGMELQILDNKADMYKNLENYQYHGSVYGVIPAKRGFLKPVGEWNFQEVMVKGPKIKVTLNGTTILDGDLTEARKKGTLDKRSHPGIFRDKGHIGFLGHGSVVYFRKMRIKEL